MSLDEPTTVSSRSTAAGQHRLFVSNPEGKPIAGATVTCACFDASWIAAERAWPELDWESLARRSVTGRTDERGELAIDAPPETCARTVLWVTHPEHSAAMFASDPGNVPRLPGAVTLAQRSRVRARALGTPEGAASPITIHALADCRTDALVELDPRSQSALRSFRQVREVKAGEWIDLAPLAVEHFVYATCGDLRSPPWIGRAPADIELDLRPTFFVGGRVTWDRSVTASVDAWVECFAVRGLDRSLLARSAVRSDGAISDLHLPVLACDSYVVECGGPEIERQYVELVDPQPGERRAVEFALARGASLTVKVVGPDALGIGGATVTAQWNDGKAWRRIERRANAEGVVAIDGFPQASVWLRVRASGFVPRLADRVDIANHDGSAIVVALAKAGVIDGRCLLAGEPAADFTVLFWTKEPKDGGKVEVRGSSDGRFRIDEAPPGEVVLMASGSTSIQSPQVRVRVEPPAAAEAVLELPAPLVAFGRIVDGATSAPVPGARLALQVIWNDQILRPWKEATLADSHGAFELSGLIPGRNCVRISAEGFAPRSIIFEAPSAERVDLGPIGLHQAGSLEVQMIGEPADYDGTRVELQGVELRPLVAVSADGRARFDALMPGSYAVRIRFPDKSTRFLMTHVAPGRDVRITTPVAAHGFEVEVIGATPEIVDRIHELRVTFAGEDGVEGDEFYPVRRDSKVRVRSLGAKSCHLEAIDREGVVLDVDKFSLSNAPDEVVRFLVEGSSVALRVVDRDRQPIAGAQVGIVGADLDPGWGRYCFTDGEGRCTLDGIAFESIGIRLRHPDHGVTAVQIVTLPRDPAQPLELVLDARLELRVRVVDHTTPLPGIELYARDLARFEDGLADSTSDASAIATWRSVAAGTYEVSVIHPGLWPDRLRVDVTPAGSVTPIQVRRLGGVDFTLSTALGHPVSGARFELRSLERDTAVSKWINEGAVPAPPHGLTTDDQGRLSVRGLPNGEFSYRALLPNGGTAEGTIHVPPFDVLQVTLRIE